MNEEIIKRHNEVIAPEDELYILGDLIMGYNLEGGLDLVSRINGRKTVIAGNHDTERRKEGYRSIGIKVLDALTFPKERIFLCHFPVLAGNYDDAGRPIRKLIKSFAGHYHTKDKFIDMKRNILCYHVEVDAHNCYPVSLETALEDIRNFSQMKEE